MYMNFNKHLKIIFANKENSSPASLLLISVLLNYATIIDSNQNVVARPALQRQVTYTAVTHWYTNLKIKLLPSTSKNDNIIFGAMSNSLFSPPLSSRSALNCISVRLSIVFTLNGSPRTCYNTDTTQLKWIFGLNYAHFYRSCFTFLRINVIIFNGT